MFLSDIGITRHLFTTVLLTYILQSLKIKLLLSLLVHLSGSVCQICVLIKGILCGGYTVIVYRRLTI